jgi:hypothetical protein
MKKFNIAVRSYLLDLQVAVTKPIASMIKGYLSLIE